ncbi:MAG: D-aminoacyl-tRNA deacylase [Candidatus Pacearchaeota archaeon]
MEFTIVASKKDLAGTRIVESLRELNCKIPIHLTDEEIIYAENIDKELNTDFIIFASKHQSVKQVKTLTVHPIGNWNKADFGGKDKTICKTSALMLKHFFQTLEKNYNNLPQFYKENIECSLEATHHGPYIETPSLFIEIGSTKEEWQDKNLADLIAKTIIEAVSTFKKNKNMKIAFGIGGPHYCQNFNQIQLSSNYALSHIVAEYALPINENMIKQILDKTKEKVTTAIIDWKGLGNSEQREKILNILKKFNLEIIRTNKAKSTQL